MVTTGARGCTGVRGLPYPAKAHGLDCHAFLESPRQFRAAGSEDGNLFAALLHATSAGACSLMLARLWHERPQRPCVGGRLLTTKRLTLCAMLQAASAETAMSYASRHQDGQPDCRPQHKDAARPDAGRRARSRVPASDPALPMEFGTDGVLGETLHHDRPDRWLVVEGQVEGRRGGEGGDGRGGRQGVSALSYDHEMPVADLIVELFQVY